jgi:8-oxo-dGTP pyrophosphatase MutT (NUDIX family)
MANKELYNNTYKIPSDILNSIQKTLISNPNGEGVKRAKFMLKNGAITYQAMKRLKNFFDYFNNQNGDMVQYELAGGNLMKSFVDRTLNANRDAVKRSKDVRRDITTNPNSELKPYQTPRLTEATKEKKELKKNAVAVIVNSDNKILLLKRPNIPKLWMPNKWSLVGGGIEKGESPEKACKREIKEETDLEIDKFVKSFTIQRNTDSIEHVFACRFNGDDSEINLDKENVSYGWFDISEMEFLDTVPHLLEYIALVFIKYE